MFIPHVVSLQHGGRASVRCLFLQAQVLEMGVSASLVAPCSFMDSGTLQIVEHIKDAQQARWSPPSPSLQPGPQRKALLVARFEEHRDCQKARISVDVLPAADQEGCLCRPVSTTWPP